MSIIKYYFIVIVIVATALTIWDKCTKNKKKSGGNTPDENARDSVNEDKNENDPS